MSEQYYRKIFMDVERYKGTKYALRTLTQRHSRQSGEVFVEVDVNNDRSNGIDGN